MNHPLESTCSTKSLTKTQRVGCPRKTAHIVPIANAASTKDAESEPKSEPESRNPKKTTRACENFDSMLQKFSRLSCGSKEKEKWRDSKRGIAHHSVIEDDEERMLEWRLDIANDKELIGVEENEGY